MAKKKPSKAQLAARAKFVKRFAKGNPRRKKHGRKRRNPETVIMEVPVRKRVSVKRPSGKDINYAWLKKNMLDEATASERKKYDSMSPSERDFMVSQAAKKLFKKTISEAEKAVGAEGRLRAKRAKGLHKERELEAQGGKVIMVKENPRKRRKKKKARRGKKTHAANPRRKRRKHAKRKHAKRRKHRRNPAADWGMVTVGNPRRKKRKHAKRRKHSKRSRLEALEIANPRRKRAKRRKHKLYYAVGKAHLTKRGKKRMARRRNLVLATNPNMKDIVSTYGVAVLGGAAFPWWNYGINKAINMIDAKLTGGKIAQVLAQANALAPGIAAPGLSLALVIAAKWADGKYNLTGKLGNEGSKYVHGALDTIAVLSAAGIGQALAAKAKVDPASMGMSGVKYFPGMAGADFGYPQMGDGYHQQPGDFGGVKYFPGAAMAGVEFYPPGSQGDSMYRTSEANQMREAQGLGIIPEGMGVIPEGMGSADFGIIPEGMGSDEGQMG